MRTTLDHCYHITTEVTEAGTEFAEVGSEQLKLLRIYSDKLSVPSVPNSATSVVKEKLSQKHTRLNAEEPKIKFLKH